MVHFQFSVVEILCSRNWYMVIAYILLTSDLGSENSVMEQLKAIPSVKEAHGVYGVYDILVKVESSSVDDLRETVTFKIRKIPYVGSAIALTRKEEQE